MPLEQIAVKKPLFEASKKPGSEHLEWCTDLNRIPKELPNVDKEIKTDKIKMKVFDESIGAEVEKEINFPTDQQSFNVDGYGYKLFSNKDKMEVRLIRWKSSGKGSSRYERQQSFTDVSLTWYTKDQRKEADAKIQELNDKGFLVETSIFTWTEKADGSDQITTETMQAVKGKKPYNTEGGSKQSETTNQDQQQQRQPGN